ncbi:hypothetical protein BDY19DRAFT_60117 [Irpex rosettiformis]|uniref:Uncharacterized protein n=1 Tax=Irpex rosettiformis TaxID=378272 RepID=A0ACB8UL54_9APHY|nr:hypothetical protein BDY19DRAFT_60117 [Irpex rosettiformis]
MQLHGLILHCTILFSTGTLPFMVHSTALIALLPTVQMSDIAGIQCITVRLSTPTPGAFPTVHSSHRHPMTRDAPAPKHDK